MIQTVRKIGNSSGVLLPKAMLQACGIEGQVEVEIRDKTIVLRPVAAPPRAHWDAAFAAALAAGDAPEGDLFEGMTNEFDRTEW
ncbi:hypothetical protein GCM10023185_29460 [Hymenobacter saemangeumensis]|uniref:SpoVT-AbrB domain-containing protein n=1 Tax=Hymenobacter saemangeumensis TaxID=1084522 RepID=A0ABP8ILL7_9BACT